MKCPVEGGTCVVCSDRLPNKIVQMPGRRCNGDSSIPTTRLGRLLKDYEFRELRRNGRAQRNGVSDDCNGFTHSQPDFSLVEQFLEGAALASQNEGYERVESIPQQKQRLLVVANRLPVSAVRRGKDSWSLDISAGGLVSALLDNRN